MNAYRHCGVSHSHGEYDRYDAGSTITWQILCTRRVWNVEDGAFARKFWNNIEEENIVEFDETIDMTSPACHYTLNRVGVNEVPFLWED